MLLLDTNVVSELRKVSHRRSDPNFIGWATTLRWTDLFISSITIYELEIGISRIELKDAAQGSLLRHWLLNQVLPRFQGRILTVDTKIAVQAAQLQLSRTRQVEDTLIAATAQVHHMKVVTRNVGDFEDTGVPILNPWQTS